MTMGLRHPLKRDDVVNIRGACIKIPPALGIGHSFFVPSLKPRETYGYIIQHYYGEEYELTYDERVEHGVLGIRVWRVA